MPESFTPPPRPIDDPNFIAWSRDPIATLKKINAESYAQIMARIETMLHKIICNQDGKEYPNDDWRRGIALDNRVLGQITFWRDDAPLATFFPPVTELGATPGALVLTTTMRYSLHVKRK